MFDLADKLGYVVQLGRRALEVVAGSGQVMMEGSPKDVEQYLMTEHTALGGIQDHLTSNNIVEGSKEWDALIDRVVAVLRNNHQEEEVTSMEGFRIMDSDLTLAGIKASTVKCREEYGRWPTHMARPKGKLPSYLVNLLRDCGDDLPRMPRLVAQGKRFWMGFDRNSKPVTKSPRWISLLFRAEAGVANDQQDAKEAVAEVVVAEVVADELVDQMVEASKPVVLQSEAEMDEFLKELGF